jgi:hypothetical protein
MPETRKPPTLEPMPDLPPGCDPARAEHIRQLCYSALAADDPEESERLWEELFGYIFGPPNP